MTSPLAIGSDHAGYALKELLKTYLDTRQICYRDFGSYSEERCDYPDLASQVALSIQRGESAQGILCCGSGVGMVMAANRFPGIRAVLGTDIYIARMSREHNNANVICFGGRMIAPEYAHTILETFLNTPFEGGRHETRIQKMDTLQHGEQVQC